MILMNRGLMHTKQVRRCVACRECKHQCEMIRLTKIDNQIYIDKKNSLGGRGAYVCKNEECIKLAVKKKLFNRAFKMNIDNLIYEQLGEYEQNN